LWADLVVCRAGAMTLAELQVVGRAAVLVPYPHATDNHQWHNAAALATAGAALVLDDDNCDGATLMMTVSQLLCEPDRVRTMGEAAARQGRPGAALDIARDLLALVDHPSGQQLAVSS